MASLFSRHKYDETGSASSSGYEFTMLKSHDVFVDIGAFHGVTSVRAAKIVRKVVAVEAYPKNFLVLVRNILKNKLTNVLPLCFAAWNKKETISLMQANPGDNSMSVKWEGSEKGRVLGLPLDDVFELWGLKPTFIRIDVVGSEIEVLKGLHKTLVRTHPVVIVISIGSNTLKLRGLMNDYGYIRTKIFDTNAYLFTYKKAGLG